MTQAGIYADLARHAIGAVLAGNPPNGTRPEDCGPFAVAVDGVFKGWHSGGTEKARKVFNTLAAGDKNLSRLMSESEGTDQGAAAPHTWGPVLPFHSADLPSFPLDVLPHWLREYCEAITETMQTPTDLAGMLAMAVLSTACARRIEVRAWEGYDEPVNIYAVISMPPGSGKSPVFKAMTGPIAMFEWQQLEKSQEAIERAEDERDILKAKLDEAKRKAARVEGNNAMKEAYSEVDGYRGELKDLEVPTRAKYIIDDATPESVTSILAEQGGRIAVLSSEGDIFAIMSGRYSSGAPNIGVYKKGHVGDDIRVDRKSRSEVVRRPAITMGITTQPEVMRSFGQNKTFQSEGLLARFFYAMPSSNVGSRKVVTAPIPPEVKDAYYHRVLNMLENLNSGNSGNYGKSDRNSDQDSGNSKNSTYISIFSNISYIEISIPAKERFTAFRTWLEPQLGPYGMFSHMADWASKLGGYVLRVAGLLHMADVAAYGSHNSHNSQNEISDATLERAIRFIQYLIPHAQAAYAEIGSDPAVEGARLVLRWIEKTEARQFTKRDCYQGVKGTLKRADELDPILSLLVDHGYLREQETAERTGPGRKPSQSYDVNPIVFSGSHNSHNSQNVNEVGAFYAPPAEDDTRGYRAIEGY